MSATETTGFRSWCIVELMGHSCIAGELYEQAIGGETFIRVDVPDVTTKRGELKGYSKLYGKGAIYAITPTDKATCALFISQNYTPPISPYSFPALEAPKGCGGCPGGGDDLPFKEELRWVHEQEDDDLPFEEQEE